MSEPEQKLMTQYEAEELTERIRRSLKDCGDLLLKAHRGRIWIAMGLSTFEAWAEKKLGVRRSQAFNLLSLARAVAAMEAVAPGLVIDLTHRHAPLLHRPRSSE